jgi:hypothetical protein
VPTQGSDFRFTLPARSRNNGHQRS